MILWSAEWCGPCKVLKPWLKANHPEIEIKDVDRSRDAIKAGVKSVPTLQVGEELYVGLPTIKDYLERKNNAENEPKRI